MLISVSHQAYIFLCAVIGGMVIAFIYDAFRIKRKAVKTSAIIIYVEDLIFWVIVSFVMFAVLYFANEGQVRAYVFIGSIIGIILYAVMFSKLIMAVFLFVIRTACKIIKYAWIVLTYPLMLILKLLSFPAVFLSKRFKKGFKKVQTVGKNHMAKFAARNKIIRNIRKKI